MGSLAEYSFKVNFTSGEEQKYILVPVMTFGVDAVNNSQAVCNLMV